MKSQAGNPRQIVDQFLGKIAEPLSDEHGDGAVKDVHQRLLMEDAHVLNFTTALATDPQPVRTHVWSAIAGVLVMLAVLFAVQGGFVGFFLYLRKRAKRIADLELDTEWSELQKVSRT